ncbi:MAG: hypothetical protein K0R17_101 [Rariglobus sp.]|nr:hypothetical protein [Rariglobus sp.]
MGLHGLALMVVFPLGTQETRLWHPGVGGVGMLAAAFPLAVVIGGLWARRRSRLPAGVRTLSWIAFLTTLPCVLSYDYPSFVAARLLAGLATGAAYVAIHRELSADALPLVGRVAPRIIAFGMPVCLAAAVVFDWRATFVPLLVAQAWLALRSTPRHTALPVTIPAPAEAAPAALVATGALAFVSAAYLTVLSGFLVFNAGHTEFHIPVVLGLAALLGLGVPPAVRRLRTLVSDTMAFAVALGFSAASLLALLALRGPQPAALAVSTIAVFLTVNSARHLTLAGLVQPGLKPEERPAHQTHTHLAHHLGSGLGALTAGALISLTPAKTFTGMPVMLGCCLAATGVALGAGFISAPKTEKPVSEAELPEFIAENENSPV